MRIGGDLKLTSSGEDSRQCALLGLHTPYAFSEEGFVRRSRHARTARVRRIDAQVNDCPRLAAVQLVPKAVGRLGIG